MSSLSDTPVTEETSRATQAAFLPLALLLCIQGFDMALHAALDQVEPMRLVANVIIGISGFLAIAFTRLVGLGGGLIDLMLNVVFLIQNGVINPVTESLRLPLFGFVVVSLVLMLMLRGRADTQADG